MDDAMGLIDGLRKTGLDKDLLNMNSLIDTVHLQIVLIYFKKILDIHNDQVSVQPRSEARLRKLEVHFHDAEANRTALRRKWELLDSHS